MVSALLTERDTLVVNMPEKTALEKNLSSWYQLHYQMSEQGFDWGMVPEKDSYKQYMTLTMRHLTKKQWNAIQQATSELGSIFNKTYHYFMKNRRLIENLGMPEFLAQSCCRSMEQEWFSLITRFDFILNDNRIKLCEANTATPQGLPESHIANQILCDYYGFRSQNKIKENLSKMWEHYFQSHKEICSDEPLYCTTYKWFSEDFNTATFIARCASDGREIRFIPLEKLSVDERGVYDEKGQQIRLLYMLYPMEFLPYDTDKQGKKIGNIFLDLIAQQKINVINPLSATIMQSKNVLADIWKLHMDQSDLFTDSEHESIEKYFIPTYRFDKNKMDDYFSKLGETLVIKPVLGREGKGVRIVTRESVEKSQVEYDDKWYDTQPFIVQQYEELPDQTVDTWSGKEIGKMICGSYLIDNKSSGIYLRVDEKITGDDCYWIGVTI